MNEEDVFVKLYTAFKPHRSPQEARAKYKKYIQQKRNQLWLIIQTRFGDSNQKFLWIADIRNTPTRPHYLVMPRQKIVGLEDPNINDVRDIFTFAWNVEVPGIPNDRKCLIVNPQQFRSQDQLHVHVVTRHCTPPHRFLTTEHLDNVLDFVQPGEGLLIWRKQENFCFARENKFSFELQCIGDTN